MRDRAPPPVVLLAAAFPLYVIGCADDVGPAGSGDGTTSTDMGSSGAETGTGVSATGVVSVDGTGDASTSDSSSGDAPTSITGDDASTTTATDSTGADDSTGGGEPVCDTVTPCKDLIAAFEPCGGDPLGTWDYVDACRPFIQADEDPMCPTDVHEQRIGGATGTLTFTETELVQQGVAHTRLSHTVTTPSCHDRYRSCDDVCAEQELAKEKTTAELCCEATGDGLCHYWWTWDDPLQDSFLPYSVEGNTMSAGAQSWEYCVDGDTMTWLVAPDGGVPWVHVYTRQP